jgi:hypothetical protein
MDILSYPEYSSDLLLFLEKEKKIVSTSINSTASRKEKNFHIKYVLRDAMLASDM